MRRFAEEENEEERIRHCILHVNEKITNIYIRDYAEEEEEEEEEEEIIGKSKNGIYPSTGKECAQSKTDYSLWFISCCFSR